MSHLANGYQVRPPGEPKGPCDDERCSLPTCMSARALAEATCELCLEPIGFGVQMLVRAVTSNASTCLLYVRHRRCPATVPKTG